MTPAVRRAVQAHWPWFLAALFTAVVSALKILQHFSLQSQAFDLGIYANVLWNTLHGRPYWFSFAGVNYMGDHFAPLLAACAPLLLVWQNAAVVLVFQSAAIGLGIPAAAALARHKTGTPWVAVCVGLWWALSPYVHRVSRFDFHEMAIVMPTLLWGILLWETRRFRAFWVLAAISLLWREDVGLLWTGFAAAVFFRSQNAADRKRACLLALMGLVYTAAAIFWAIPAFGGWRGAAAVYSGLGNNFPEILSSLLRPDRVWQQSLGQPVKAWGLAQILLSAGALPLLAPSTWPAWLVPLGINTLTDRPWQYGFQLHYSAGAMPFLLWGMLEGWARLAKWLPPRAARAAPVFWAVVLAAALARWKPYYLSVPAERRVALRELKALVPDGDAVMAQTNLLPHLAFRERLFLAPGPAPARWVALDAAPVGFTPPEEYRYWLEDFHRRWSDRLVYEKAGLRLYRAD